MRFFVLGPPMRQCTSISAFKKLLAITGAILVSLIVFYAL